MDTNEKTGLFYGRPTKTVYLQGQKTIPFPKLHIKTTVKQVIDTEKQDNKNLKTAHEKDE